MIYRIPYDTEMSKDLLAKYIGKHKEYVRAYARPFADAY